MENKKMTALPDFESPPVVEVVCGVSFNPPRAFKTPHIGRLWERFLDDFPAIEEQPPLPQIVERFDENLEQQIHFSNVPPVPRVWLVSEDSRRLIQLQRDRFLYNWRKVDPDGEYPRFPEIYKEFEEVLATYRSFLAQEKLGDHDPIQYELTYVNHIVKGEGWDSLGDIGSVLRFCSWKDDNEFLKNPEGVEFRLTFPFPGWMGRLHAKIQTARRTADRKDVLLLDLTARGMASEQTGESRAEWFEMAREWIVRGFCDLTASEVQSTQWGRRK